jgi:hypothetical protein
MSATSFEIRNAYNANNEAFLSTKIGRGEKQGRNFDHRFLAISSTRKVVTHAYVQP